MGPHVFCIRCGHANPIELHSCTSCGAELTGLRPALETAEQGKQSERGKQSEQGKQNQQGKQSEQSEQGKQSEGGQGETTVFSLRSTAHANGVLAADRPETATQSGGALTVGVALLVIKGGPLAGARFSLESELSTAGRHPNSDILLDDVTVSRRHAEFHRRDGAFMVRDVGSLNGTYVNGGRVEEALLSGNDAIQIGRFRLVFMTPG